MRYKSFYYSKGTVFPISGASTEARIRFKLLCMTLKLPARLLFERLVDRAWEEEKDKITALGHSSVEKSAHKIMESRAGETTAYSLNIESPTDQPTIE